MATAQTSTVKKTTSRTTASAKVPPAKAAAKTKNQSGKTASPKAKTAAAAPKKVPAKKLAALPAKKVAKPVPAEIPVFVKPAASSLVMTAEQRYKSIEAAAYLRAEKRGFASGHALEDWIAAEREIDAMLKDM